MNQNMNQSDMQGNMSWELVSSFTDEKKRQIVEEYNNFNNSGDNNDLVIIKEEVNQILSDNNINLGDNYFQNELYRMILETISWFCAYQLITKND